MALIRILCLILVVLIIASPSWALRKNIGSQVVCAQLNSKTDGSAVTSGTTNVYVTGDGGTQGGTGTATGEGYGLWCYVPSQAETNYNHVAYTFVNTSAANVSVQYHTIGFDPTVANLPANVIQVNGTSQTARDLGASVLLSSGTGTGQISLSSGTVTVGTNNDKTGYTASTVSDKTGYSLTQAFPTNFSSMAITAGGAVTVGTNNDKTGYTASTVSDKTGYSLTQTFPTNFASLGISVGGAINTCTDVTNAVTVSTGTGAGQLDVTSGRIKADTVYWSGTAVGTPYTAGYPIVTVKNGAGVGEIATGSGAISQVDIVTELTNLGFGSIGSNALDSSAANEIRDAVWSAVTRSLTDKSGFSLTQTFPTNFSSMAITAGGEVTAGTVSDKTGYSLTQTFPTNFASLGISAGGAINTVTSATTCVSVTNDVGITQAGADKVWGTAARSITDKAGFSLSADQSGVTIGTCNAISATGIDGLWDEEIDNSISARNVLKYSGAILGGITSGGGGSNLSFKQIGGGSTTRVEATVDANGNRTSVTVTP